ncbi:ABC-2 type transport system ATP-binding protein [Tumebacillus sp. BK434]|uniref:ABC transporter ATP-binding protein n=1 Tax=Tumebacillus sp. BK434 TaxID=2512169 RepID=UPI00104734CD|nr:ABC transporter ATP-binding protein [Tumebacillus sp. BK434]TCP52536.1 ABC-2 type transport system ATP-binding protein [Tumebacillus sp. BK434]
MSGYALETRGLTKVFDGERALDRLSLVVPHGSIFGLMGPNGAGKSTLIRLLLGVLQPTAGDATVLGRSIADPSGVWRQEIGYVADYQNFFPHYKVGELLAFCAKLYPNWDDKRCRDLLDLFQIPSGKRVRALSKGMKTQLALIIALSMRPRMLLLDEPTSGLDPVMKHHFKQLVLQAAASGDTTVFFSTHNLNDLEQMADHVAVLMKGKLLFTRSLDELKENTCKIQAVFSEGLPDAIREAPGVLSVQEQGKVSTIIVQDHTAALMGMIEAHRPDFVETLDLSLEEVFIQTMGKEGYAHDPAFRLE